jgi:hypothetical protein
MSAKKQPAKKAAKKSPKAVHKPTDQQRRTVEAMSGYGVTREAIAAVVGVHYNTLAKHYATELEVGRGKAMAKVAQNLFQIATGTGRDSVTAAIFYLKCRAGWKPPADVEIVNTINNAAPSNLTPVEKKAVKDYVKSIQAEVRAQAASE